jgi:hypothetical protein
VTVDEERMLKSLKRLGCILSLLVLASSAFGAGYLNDRQITPADGGASLQTMLDQIFGCNGCVDAINNQQDAAMWRTATQTSPSISSTIQFRYTATGGTDAFGIWSNAGAPVMIFNSSAAAGSTATLKWNSNGYLSLIGMDANGDLDCANINCISTSAQNSSINPNAFGFYLQNAGGSRFFTLDELNGGSAQALMYYNASDWIIAFNDGSGPSNFNDFVVDVQSIAALPEPRSIVLLGTALLVACTIGRRRMLRRQSR